MNRQERVTGVDRIAEAMTTGAPSRSFTARVMAPIHGRPRPDFAARVMQRVAAAERTTRAAGRGFSPASRHALILIPAALIVTLGIVVLRGSGVTMPTVPAAPILAAAPGLRTPVAADEAPHVVETRTAPRPSHLLSRGPRPARPPVVTEAPPIYTIAALDGPSMIDVKPIEPSTPAVLPLTGPAPLKVTDLPGTPGGSRDQKFKERP